MIRGRGPPPPPRSPRLDSITPPAPPLEVLIVFSQAYLPTQRLRGLGEHRRRVLEAGGAGDARELSPTPGRRATSENGLQQIRREVQKQRFFTSTFSFCSAPDQCRRRLGPGNSDVFCEFKLQFQWRHLFQRDLCARAGHAGSLACGRPPRTLRVLPLSAGRGHWNRGDRAARAAVRAGSGLLSATASSRVGSVQRGSGRRKNFIPLFKTREHFLEPRMAGQRLCQCSKAVFISLASAVIGGSNLRRLWAPLEGEEVSWAPP